MELVTLLKNDRASIIADAVEGLKCAHMTHYIKAGDDEIKNRLENLFDITMSCVDSKQLPLMLNHAERIAKERFEAGFDLYEIQVAFNALEEIIWKKIIDEVEKDVLASALGMISTVLGSGKEHLACTYVELASRKKTPTLDVKALFEG